MNDIMQTTAVIRQRGQITIPDELRERFSWITPNSVVTITASLWNGLIIKPYSSEKTDINWKKIWENINLVRSFKGKRGNLSQFIIADRKDH